MGVIPKVATVYEVLEEIAITAQNQLAGSRVPFCAFNGGADVFVDVRRPPRALRGVVRMGGCSGLALAGLHLLLLTVFWARMQICMHAQLSRAARTAA